MEQSFLTLLFCGSFSGIDERNEIVCKKAWLCIFLVRELQFSSQSFPHPKPVAKSTILVKRRLIHPNL